MTIKLDVTYQDAKPQQIEYFDMIYGMVKFHMVGTTAVIDDKWNEVDASGLADGYEQQVYTEDIVEAVEELPFVQAVTLDSEQDDE